MPKTKGKFCMSMLALVLFAGAAYAAQEELGCPQTITEGSVIWSRVGSGWTETVCVTVGGGVIPASTKDCTTTERSRYMSDAGNFRDRNCTTNSWA